MHKASSATMCKILEVPRSIHPRIHIDVPVWNHFRELHLPLQYKELEFQRSYHPKNWCSKLQMSKGIFCLKAGFLKLQDPSTPDLILKLQWTCELHHLPQYKELEFQRSFHPKNGSSKLQMPKGIFYLKAGFLKLQDPSTQTWYWSILAYVRNWMF